MWMNFVAATAFLYATDGEGGASATIGDSRHRPTASTRVVCVPSGILVTAQVASNVLILASIGNLRHTLAWTSASRSVPFYVPIEGRDFDGLSVITSDDAIAGTVFFRDLPNVNV
jgi:hypothetical protein